MNEPEFKPSPDTDECKEIINALAESSIYRDYADDFSRITGLPVSLTPVESWQLAHHDQTRQSPFCALLAPQSPACAACLRTQHMLTNVAAQSARTVACVHGLCETAVPVRAGSHLVGFIRTGQVFRRTPTPEGFERVRKRLAGWDVTIDAAKLRKAYFATRVMAPTQYRSAVGLLGFLARHLSLLSNQILLQQDYTEPPMIANAKRFIAANYGEKLTLRQMADAVHVSHFYFCKLFKSATGINFSHYVSRFRVEKAKNLVLNPHYRISEIAYSVGFESLGNFNRMFKRFTGLNPTAYRAQLGTWRNGRQHSQSAGDNCIQPEVKMRKSFAGNGYERGGSTRRNQFVGSAARAFKGPLTILGPEKSAAVKIKMFRSAILDDNRLPDRGSRPWSGPETSQPITPAPQFGRVNA